MATSLHSPLQQVFVSGGKTTEASAASVHSGSDCSRPARGGLKPRYVETKFKGYVLSSKPLPLQRAQVYLSSRLRSDERHAELAAGTMRA